MLDIKKLRVDPQGTEKKLRTKETGVELEPILALDEGIRHIKTEVEALKSKRNQLSKQVGVKKRKGEDASTLLSEVGAIGEKIPLLDEELRELNEKYTDALSRLPNIPFDDIPVSSKAADNVPIKEVGKKPSFTFEAKNHVELNDMHHLFDFKAGAKIAGTGWPVYKGMGARLEWALLNYMLETHIKNGFMQVIPPHLVRPEIMFGSGQLPKFSGQFYEIEDKDFDLYLIPTSEVPINGMHFDEILDSKELPKKYVAYTPCFRREAGAAGAGERGLIRTHQFNKVEMFCFTHPEESAKVFDEMVASAEEILDGLGMHYRSMLLVTGDMSFTAAKTIDVEVWLPGQDRYYEVSSVSNCTDFQARRSGARYKEKEGKPEFVHTLNGSGVATSRLMVALLENNQREDGSILIPKVLQKHLGGLEILDPTTR